MKKSYIFSFVAVAALAMSSCSKDEGFSGEKGGEGQLLKAALSMDVKDDATIRKNAPTRAGVSADDFTVVITQAGHSEPTAKYLYAEMPEVVTLPAGKYTVIATYGENRNAAWESPYYIGKSEEFEIVAYEINSYIDPIECRLDNVMVSVEFDADLRANMSDDSYVEVKVGDNEGLKYTLAEADAKKPGYFKHVGETTLVATFHGTVDGTPAEEIKTLASVEKGNHYRITFKRHTHGGDATGSAQADVNVDASVTITNVERNVDLAEDQPLDDSERPNESDPVGPVNPDPGQTEEAPAVTAQAPIDLSKANVVAAGTNCVINITSSAADGITGFVCDIESPTLTPEELEGVGLSSHLDLVNPGSLQGTLNGLGLLQGSSVKGLKSVEFNLTGFIPMLAALGPGTHNFVLSVSDANGTTTQTLTLVIE